MHLVLCSVVVMVLCYNYGTSSSNLDICLLLKEGSAVCS
jgi:hypothetical protein